MHVAIAQIAPVWLDRIATLQKVVAAISEAGARQARLVVFGEALVPGYPFWIEHTDGARFGNDLQKTLFAHYCAQAVVSHAAISMASARRREYKRFGSRSASSNARPIAADTACTARWC